MYCNEAIAFFNAGNLLTNGYLCQCLKYRLVNVKTNGNIGNGSLNKTTLNILQIKVPSLDDQ